MLLNCGVGEASFFFLSFIFISWRLIILQYGSGFCHTLTCPSADEWKQHILNTESNVESNIVMNIEAHVSF